MTARRENLRWRRYAIDRNWLSTSHASQHFLFFITRGIADVQLQHETVDLCFRERIRSFLLNRVLRSKNEKGFFEYVRRAADRDLFLLHRLEQRRLYLGGRAVDLVSKNDVGEDRSFLHGELSVRLVVDLGADDIGGQEIGRELNPA